MRAKAISFLLAELTATAGLARPTRQAMHEVGCASIGSDATEAPRAEQAAVRTAAAR